MRDAMIEFAEFQQKSKQLATSFAQTYGQHVGCLSFFSILALNHVAMDDTATISLLAHRLDETYELIRYVRYIKRDQNLTLHEVRYLAFNKDSSRYGFCVGIMSSLRKCM
jgi:hypothetical protein